MTSPLFGCAAVLWALIASMTAAQIYNDRCPDQCITINVYFHAITYDDGSLFFHGKEETLDSIVPMIDEAMAVLNYEFEHTPFSFDWRNRDSISTVANTDWSTNICYLEWELNEWSFLGDYEKSINVYLAHEVVSGGLAVACGSFPFFHTNFVGMRYDILPPGGNGLALPHEVGHWLGLFHTYDASGATNWEDPCHPSNPGDFVEDTPIQIKFVPEDHSIVDYDEFSAEWDSCPSQPGQDSFWNIMNYVCPRRTCFEGRGYFTEGQIQRMYEQWLLFREHYEDCKEGEQILFSLYSSDQDESYDQVLIVDENGDEVFNLRTSWFDYFGEFDVNLCLYRNVTYTVIHNYDNSPTYRRAEFFFGADTDGGEMISTTANFRAKRRGFGVNAILYRGRSKLVHNITDSRATIADALNAEGCSDTNSEALLEIQIEEEEEEDVTTAADDDIVDGNVWLAIYNNTMGRGYLLGSTRNCIKRGHYYSVLVGFENSNATNLTILLDGNVITMKEGPFYSYLWGFPRMISTLITPDMLETRTSHPSSLESAVPTYAPTVLSNAPSTRRSDIPSESPTVLSNAPSSAPSGTPSLLPSDTLSLSPSALSSSPSSRPSRTPVVPSVSPTIATIAPAITLTTNPTQQQEFNFPTVVDGTVTSAPVQPLASPFIQFSTGSAQSSTPSSSLVTSGTREVQAPNTLPTVLVIAVAVVVFPLI